MSLYKYFEPERTTILETQKLRYTQINALNDPFEGKPFYSRLAPDAELKAVFGDGTGPGEREGFEMVFELMSGLLTGIQSVLPEEKKSEMHEALAALPTKDEFIAEVIKSYPDFVQQTILPLSSEMMPQIRQRIIEHFNSHLGILCLTEDYNSNLMWAHYAKNSQGFVLGFNPHHAYFDRLGGDDSRLNTLRRVNYSEKRPSARHLLQLAVDDIVFTKPIDWSYEHEWRIVRPLSDCEPVMDNGEQRIDSMDEPIYVQGFPTDAVDSLILGSRIDPNVRELIFEIMSQEPYEHVKLYQAYESERLYSLEFEAIRENFGGTYRC